MNRLQFQRLTRFALRDLQGSSAMRALWVFCASLVLGITLVAACANLLQLVKQGFDTEQRYLFGGDLQISQRTPIPDEQLAWVTDNAEVSRLLELRTMLGTEAGDFTVVELQSVDSNYPLYGEVILQPQQSLAEAVSVAADGTWGVAFDPVLAEQLNIAVGDKAFIGSLQVELRAIIVDQPDRSLRADVRGPPVIIDATALAGSGLLTPTSLVDYDYRIRTEESPQLWRSRLQSEFPDAAWEVQTVDERGDIVSERLDQVASVLLLIGFSTLFIGGLGVSNSISAYLQTKFGTLATLQSLGCRDRHVTLIFVGQVLFLGFLASTVGAILGSLIAWTSALLLSARLPINTHVVNLVQPTLLSIAFGTFTALLFALPLLGSTLTLPTAQLIRGWAAASRATPANYRAALAATSVILVVLLLALIPQPMVAVGFVVVLMAMLGILMLLVSAIKTASRQWAGHRALDGRISIRLAIANLGRDGSSLKPMLLSLGTAMTLLVASTLIIAATVNTLTSSVPARAPSLVFYDLQQSQRDDFTELMQTIDGFQELAVAPLVLGRLSTVNGEQLSGSNNAERALEANDEHKLSYRQNGIDSTEVVRGQWWPENYSGPTLVAMEDREADQLGLTVGDELVFSILGESVEATLSAIYSQARFETSFWLEAVFSDGVLQPFITRNIGSLRFDAGTNIAAMSSIAERFPNVVLLRTAKILAAARDVLSQASAGMLAIAIVSLAASVLVMASVVAVSRQRQVYEASVMYAIGTRMSLIMKSVVVEYVLLACVLTLFATLTGSAIAWVLLTFWLKLSIGGVWVIGLLVAAATSTLCLCAGAWWLLRSLTATPAILLKQSTA